MTEAQASVTGARGGWLHPAFEAAAVLTDSPHEAVDALLALTGPGADPPQILVEVRQMGGAVGRREDQESAFCARDTAYSLLTVGLAGTPGVRSAGTTPAASWPIGRVLFA